MTKYTDEHIINSSKVLTEQELNELIKWIMDLCIHVYDKGFEGGLADDISLLDWYRNNLHAYFCGDCDNRFFIEEIVKPSDATCPYCGGNDVAINSGDYAKI